MYLDLCAMKYFILLLSSLVLAFCSGPSEVTDSNNESKLSSENDKNSSFSRLPTDIIRLIATFMEPGEIVNWRYVNCLTLSSLSLKKLVEQIFNISGLECISDNEPELAGVLRFARNSHDPFLFFKALINDIICENKPYNVLFRPLTLNLFQTFSGLGFQEKQDYQRYFINIFNCAFENYLIEACFEKEHFGLVLGIVRNNSFLSGKALESAARLGHTNIVEILLQSRTDIPSHYAGCAIQCAAKSGHTHIFELLLQRRTDIPSYYVGWALRNAAESGHMHIVELILHRRTDISANDAITALDSAARNGHTSIVELLLQHFNDIPVKYVEWALEDASKNGHTSIVDLLLHHRKDITAKNVGLAFRIFFVIRIVLIFIFKRLLSF
jgi:hypothetical protein